MLVFFNICLFKDFKVDIILIINLYILFSVCWFFFYKNQHTVLKYILLLTAFNIILTEFLRCYSISYKFSTNIFLLITNFLWLTLIAKYYKKKTIYFIFFLITLISYNIQGNIVKFLILSLLCYRPYYM